MLLALSLCACKKDAPDLDLPADASPDVKLADDIFFEVIKAYGKAGSINDKNVVSLLDELAAADEAGAELCRDIVTYWDYANNEMAINDGCLPDGLPDDKSLCIIVLGFELNADGTMKEELEGRLETALKCADKYPNAYILCTGGATAIDNQDATEAGVMGAWLEEKGIDKERLIVEDKSLSTAENAIYSCKILKSGYPGVSSAAIVSSDYHIPWGAVLFETEFLKEAYEGEIDTLHVVSNAAFKTENTRFTGILSYQTSGIQYIMQSTQ